MTGNLPPGWTQERIERVQGIDREDPPRDPEMDYDDIRDMRLEDRER